MNGEALYLLSGLALGWLTLAVAALLFRIGRRWWRQRRYGPPLDHGLLLASCCRQLTSLEDRQALAAYLTQELPQRLEMERADLLLPEAYQLIAIQTGQAGPGALSLPVSHAALRWVASAGEAQRADHGRLQTLIAQGRTDLSWAKVWVPLMRGSELRGLWLLGPRRSAPPAQPFSADDLRWLTAVGREAVAVLEAFHHTEQERLAASEMRALYRQMVRAREVERARLSRELHDGVLQDLCAVTRDLKALETQAAGGPAEAPFSGLAARSGETVNALRGICNGLRPPLLAHDLAAALHALVAELAPGSDAALHIDIAARPEELRLPDEEALAIFRITQEALRNAIQHADASEVAVRLTGYPDRLRLTVTDDGKGLPGGGESARFVAQGHFGLAGMRERSAMIGASLEVQTALDYGTVVILELPR